jgi:excisionase family DNA binding protein
VQKVIPNLNVSSANEMTLEPYLTAKETIAYLKLGSTSALYRLIREHRLPFCRVGRNYRFEKRELDAWMRGFGSAIEQLRARGKAL